MNNVNCCFLIWKHQTHRFFQSDHFVQNQLIYNSPWNTKIQGNVQFYFFNIYSKSWLLFPTWNYIYFCNVIFVIDLDQSNIIDENNVLIRSACIFSNNIIQQWKEKATFFIWADIYALLIRIGEACIADFIQVSNIDNNSQESKSSNTTL